MSDAAKSREDKKTDRTERLDTSPAFDQWLDRQVKMLLKAADSTPDPKIRQVIGRFGRKPGGKVTE